MASSARHASARRTRRTIRDADATPGVVRAGCAGVADNPGMNPSQPTAHGEPTEDAPLATRVDDVRIRDVRPLISPALLQYELAITEPVQQFVEDSRRQIAAILRGEDSRRDGRRGDEQERRARDNQREGDCRGGEWPRQVGQGCSRAGNAWDAGDGRDGGGACCFGTIVAMDVSNTTRSGVG